MTARAKSVVLAIELLMTGSIEGSQQIPTTLAFSHPLNHLERCPFTQFTQKRQCCYNEQNEEGKIPM
ncbi:hypothetical protein [Lentibacillus sp. CBA3610]|uniref:hypothetical protein n=1 Tax=Lentibacillus sp. CBA3610 TaxID=2518176 RepID=UPI0020D2527B|nr:hypothetical protein [Lentibacillus sp. CBA3610]